MQEITSVNNSIIKTVHSLQQKKYRNKLDLFIIEGTKGIEEAIKYGLDIEYVFVSNQYKGSFDVPVHKIYSVTEQILKKISTTETPPEVVAVAHMVHFSLLDVMKDETPLILVLENVKDAGNLGTIIRTAVAANVSGIILTDDTVDVYNPKTVRSSAANLWKIPVVKITDKTKLKDIINKEKSCQFLGTVVTEHKKPVSYYEVDYKKPTVLMFGSEAEGLSEELKRITDESIIIPMNKQVESLNLSISAGVILYEAVRQKLLA